MSLDFNFGEHIHYNSSSFLLGLITSIIGAFVGFLGALLINRKQDNSIREKELQEKINSYKDKLNYLALFIKSVIDTTKNQLTKYKEFSEVTAANPLEISLPELLATYDFERLKNYSSDELLEAYIYFNAENSNRLKNYKNIFSHADFLYKSFTEFLKEIEKHQLFIHKDQLRIADLIEDIALKIGLKTKNIQILDPDNYLKNPEFQYLHCFEKKYVEISNGFADFKKMRDEFLLPLHESLFANLADQEYADSIFILVKKGLTRLKNIEGNSLQISADFNISDEGFDNAINYLTNIMNEITHPNNV